MYLSYNVVHMRLQGGKKKANTQVQNQRGRRRVKISRPQGRRGTWWRATAVNL